MKPTWNAVQKTWAKYSINHRNHSTEHEQRSQCSKILNKAILNILQKHEQCSDEAHLKHRTHYWQNFSLKQLSFAIVESILEHFLNVCFEEGWGGWRTIVSVEFFFISSKWYQILRCYLIYNSTHIERLLIGFKDRIQKAKTTYFITEIEECFIY